MNLNDIAAESHAIAVQKGWYDNGGPSPLECHMLMVTELAEASEEVRNKKLPLYLKGSAGFISCEVTHAGITEMMSEVERHYGNLENLKPEGEATELADVIIRIGDYFAKRGWDLEAVVKLKMDYNRTRPQKHGGKAL